MSSLAKDNTVITQQCKKRIFKDVLEIINCPLTDNNIYYKHADDNILKGHATIIGPSDTIYEYGIYEFDFEFPTDYPFSPPKLKYLTNDKNSTRFHPNLYRSGKVCISILNTWNGEQWTSCQTISTILLTLVTLFHNNSLLNEPGIAKTHRDFKNYHTIIKFRNYEHALCACLFKHYKKIKTGTYDEDLKTFLDEKIIKNKDTIIKHISDAIGDKKDDTFDNTCLRTGIYSITANINYVNVLAEIKRIFNFIQTV
jgi:ubiquitin-protein ligase